jgi:ribonuclease VapC
VIIDSSALVAVILQEPEEARFAEAILRHGAPRMSAASWMEAATIIDSHKRPEGRIRFDEVITAFRIDIVPVTAEIAVRARRAYNQYGCGQHPARLNYGDCLAYATAAVTGQPLLFKGQNFAQTDIKPALSE